MMARTDDAAWEDSLRLIIRDLSCRRYPSLALLRYLEDPTSVTIYVDGVAIERERLTIGVRERATIAPLWVRGSGIAGTNNGRNIPDAD